MAEEGCQVGACVRGQYVACVSFFLTACQWLEERLAGWGIYLAVHRECGDAEQGGSILCDNARPRHGMHT
jgi:hypothetical protein